ncbi:MAG: hypothetical protein ACFFCP_13300, partial [Promethearchaeota archaeon]
YLVSPPKLNSAAPIEESTRNKLIQREDKVKLYFYYLGILLFLVTFMIGEFYQVMFDLLLPISQGTTGDVRVASVVAFQSIFSAGWIGTLPWLGQVAYHKTWEWIYFTAAFTDNLGFLSAVSVALIQFSIEIGIVFLIPLASKTIRHSFLPSMFFFLTGMAVFTKTAINSLAYAVALAFGGVELEYFAIVARGDMIPGIYDVVMVLFAIVVAMYILFVALGRKLWTVYYTDSRSKTWFMVYITLSFLAGFTLSILAV